jgi:hypothetical protein
MPEGEDGFLKIHRTQIGNIIAEDMRNETN